MKHGVSAWAGMLIAGERSWMQCGLIKRRERDTTYCELMAVAYSLQWYATNGDLERGDQLIICMDNLQGVQYLAGDLRPRPKDRPMVATVEHVRRIALDLELDLTSSWVESHQGHDTCDWRGLINSRVDRQARWRARQEVARLKKAAENEASE